MTAGASLKRLADDLAELPERWVRDSADRIVKAVSGTLRADTGDSRLSGVGARLSTTVTVDVSAVTVDGEVAAGPRRSLGPWSWLQDGTSARSQGAGRHPGTRAKSTWSRAVDPLVPQLLESAARDFDRVVR